MSLLAAGAAVAGILGKAIGEIGAGNAKKQYENLINAQAHRDPLTALGNQSLIKMREQQKEDDRDQIKNRAVAGGATFENQLASMKAMNRADSDFQSQLLLNEDARRQQYDMTLANMKQQDANTWQSWGQSFLDSGMQLGNALMMDGGKLLSKGLHGNTRPANVPFIPGSKKIESIASKAIPGLVQ